MRGSVDCIKVTHWREKCKAKTKVIRQLKSQNKWLQESRENWKEKHSAQQEQIKAYEKSLASKGEDFSLNNDSVKYHRYGLGLITLVLHLLGCSGIGYRKCRELLVTLHFWGILTFQIPSYSTIRYWEQKMGLYYLQTLPSPEVGRWVLIVDESVAIGQERLMLLLGVRLECYDFAHALGFDDTIVLSLGVKKSWKHTDISDLIGQLQHKGYRFEYAVADQGNNICKALKNNNIVHIKDIDHVLSLLLEKRYKNDTFFKDFCQACTKLRRKGILSTYAHMLPPKQRAKARFANLDALLRWAQKMILVIKHPPKDQQPFIQHVDWLLAFEELVGQLSQILACFARIKKILKTNGLNQQNILHVEQILDEAQLEESLACPIKAYCKNMSALLPGEKNIICSSDIIESFFGKFKTPGKTSIGEQILRIPNYGSPPTQLQVKQAMESVKIIDLHEWTEKKLKYSSSKERNRMFKKCADFYP